MPKLYPILDVFGLVFTDVWAGSYNTIVKTEEVKALLDYFISLALSSSIHLYNIGIYLFIYLFSFFLLPPPPPPVSVCLPISIVYIYSFSDNPFSINLYSIVKGQILVMGLNNYSQMGIEMAKGLTFFMPTR